MYDGNREDLAAFQYKLVAQLGTSADWFPTEKIALRYLLLHSAFREGAETDATSSKS